jgi:hypothetical protein
VVAGISGTVAMIGLLVQGPSAVNLDSLLENPRGFYALLVGPALLAVTSGLVWILPRTAKINLAVLIGLLVAAEAGAWALKPAALPLRGEPEAIGAPSFYLPDRTLGHVLAPSTEARHRRRVGDAVIYDVRYSIDARGRRGTPTASSEREFSLLFFGDSNTFGEGLGQAETLPYYAGRFATGYRPYNYGVPGYGPAHVLALADLGRLPDEVAERDGYAVFFLIPAHVARVIGTAKVSAGWGRHFPYYRPADHGTLVSEGDFVHGRPLTTLAYFFLGHSNLVEYFGVDLPGWYTAGDYELTARILGEAAHRLAQQVHLRGFIVILGQAYDEAQLRVIHRLRDALARERIRSLDYTALFDRRDPRYRLSEFDYHNSAVANRILAAQLVSDLGIGESRGPTGGHEWTR